MNSAEGIAKETFTDVYTYDETFETVQMDGYGDVLKLTAKNVISYETSGGVSTGVVSGAKNVTIRYSAKSSVLEAYDTVRFSVYNPYDEAVPIHIMDSSWGTAPDGYYSKGELKAKTWTEIEMSTENFVKAGKILFECATVMRDFELDSVEFYISDITAYGRLYVMSLIDDLPEADTLTAVDKESVQAVLAEYNKLSDEHKLLVINYDKLKACLQVIGISLEEKGGKG